MLWYCKLHIRFLLNSMGIFESRKRSTAKNSWIVADMLRTKAKTLIIFFLIWSVVKFLYHITNLKSQYIEAIKFKIIVSSCSMESWEGNSEETRALLAYNICKKAFELRSRHFRLIRLSKKFRYFPFGLHQKQSTAFLSAIFCISWSPLWRLSCLSPVFAPPCLCLSYFKILL